MTTTRRTAVSSRKPLRLWPGVVGVSVLWFFWLTWSFFSRLAPDAMMVWLLGAAVGVMVVVAWWLFFSRAPWIDRLGALAVMALVVLLINRVVHPSVSNGMMGMMPTMYQIPLLCLALVASAVIGRRLANGPRRALMTAALVAGAATLALVRTEGVTGGGSSQLHWRWTKTAEERLLAEGGALPAAPAAVPAPAAAPPDTTAAVAPATPAAPKAVEPPTPAATPAVVKLTGEWPGFRGAARDSIIRGVRIDTNWSARPPREIWRRPIGPGWSSFAVHGDLIYTQEQRGEEEVVSCYRLTNGEPVWHHSDRVRFYESNGGPGPRATPAVHGERVYTQGATGLVNALDAATGAQLWSRNAAADTGAPMPGWGFAGSPVVHGAHVIVAASGRLVAYDAATGTPRWTRQTEGGGYSSPHVATIAGVPQIVLLSGGGATGVSPADGSALWSRNWTEGVAIVQPALAGERDVLIAAVDAMGGQGLKRIALTPGASGWTIEERWSSRGLKPYFSDFVVHEGHAYGFDGSIMSCINLEDGERTWKGGRYGSGQLVLLPEQDLLFVLSEEGEFALVSATPDKHTELAKFKAIEGKTWNHPVVVGDIVLARNGEEMAAFRLPIAGRR